jgi:ABC-type Fe3+ transport system permease subunit
LQMNAKLSRQMTMLGLGVLVFYAGILATGHASLEILPQFAISAVIFLSSGRIMRQIAEKLPVKEQQEDEKAEQPNWELRNLVLNWVAAAAVVSIVALFLVKPASMSFNEFGRFLLKMDVVITDYSMPIAP